MPANLEDMLDGKQPAPPDDVASLPESPQEPQTPAPASPAAPSFSLPAPIASRMQAAGFKTDGLDSHDKAYEYLLSQYEQTKPYAEFGRSALASQPAAAQDNQHAPEGTEDEGQNEFDLDGHFSSLWSAPELDSSAQYAIQAGIVQLGEDGLYEAVPGREALALPILPGLNQAHVAQREQLQGLFKGNFYQNTFKAYQPAIEHLVTQRLNALLAERFQERDHQGFEEKFIEQHRSWLYGQDGRTLSADGQRFTDAVAQLRQGGVSNPQQLADWAMKLAGINSNAGSGQQEAGRDAAAPAPTDGRERDPSTGKFVKQAGMPAPAPVATKQESFLDEARRKAGMSGSQGGYASAGGEVIANDGELENLWTSEWKKHTAGAAA